MHQVQLQGNHVLPIRDIGYTFTHKGWTHPDRITDYNVFIYVIQGQMQVFEDGTDYLLREGDCFFLKSGVHHWGDGRTLPGTSTYWIHFYDSLPERGQEVKGSEEQLQHVLIAPSLKVYTPEHYQIKLLLPKRMQALNAPYLARKLKELYELYNSSRAFRHLHLSITAMEIFLDLLRQSENSSPLSKADATVCRLVEYLEEHCVQELNTEHIRQTFQLNYNYISTLFKEKLGISIFKYHERLRIHYSAQLLKTTFEAELLPVLI